MKQHGNHTMSYCKMLATLICVPALFACSDATTEPSNKADASAAMKDVASKNIENKAAEDSIRADITKGSSDMTSGVDYHSQDLRCQCMIPWLHRTIFSSEDPPHNGKRAL